MRFGFHEIADVEEEERRFGLALRPVELAAVDRLGIDGARDEEGGDAGEHERHDGGVRACELVDHEDRHDRRAGHGGEEAAHADDGEVADGDGGAGKELAEDFAVERAEDRADEKRWGENAADGAAAGGGHGGEDLEKENGDERIPGPLSIQDRFDDAIAVAPDFGMPDGNDADDEAAKSELESAPVHAGA